MEGYTTRKSSHLPKMKKRMRTYIASFDNFLFKIEEEVSDVGAYLYIYKNHKCIYDSLQNDIATCKELALEEYGVSLSYWVECDSDKTQ